MKAVEHDFQLPNEQNTELKKRYEDLEVIVKRLKKIMKELNGFNLIMEPYVKLYDIIAPNNTIVSSMGKFNLRIFFNAIFATISAFVFIFIGMPAISGFMKLPWAEMVPIIIAFIAMSLVAKLKQKLGVIPG